VGVVGGLLWCVVGGLGGVGGGGGGGGGGFSGGTVFLNLGTVGLSGSLHRSRVDGHVRHVMIVCLHFSFMPSAF